MLAGGVLLLLAAAAYMALLFAIASFGDRRAAAGRSLIDSSVVYALSLAVYCTSWTFYGSVGRAASRGLGLPSFASAGWLPRELFEQGALGISVLRPSALFGLDGLDPVTHGLFWSMLLNIAGIIGVSLFVDQSALERSQAALFVDYWRGAGHEEGRLWRGTAQVADLVQLVEIGDLRGAAPEP